MKLIQSIIRTNMLLGLLLISSAAYSVSFDQGRTSPNSAPLPNAAIYVHAELLELHPKKIVTTKGTYSITYIQVLDQRILGVHSGKPINKNSKGKVTLKMTSDRQLLEVVLY